MALSFTQNIEDYRLWMALQAKQTGFFSSAWPVDEPEVR
jgi:hypothetical protein